MNTMPLEEDSRVLINRSLENLGWKLSGKDQNVFYEQPKTEEERKKLCGKRPDYVLYSKESDTPLIVIEAKKKGARIDTALEQGIDYARAIGAPLVFATDGVFCKAFHTLANRPPILNGEEVDELIREALALRFLNSYEVNTVSPKVLYDRRELIKIFDEANNVLRGDGLRAGIERFGEFANILFIKLISENEQIKREAGIFSRFDIASCSWDSIKNIPASARIEYVNNTVFNRLNELYETEIFERLKISDAAILKEIMDKLDPLMLTDVDSDVKGDAFEYFLKASASTKNDLGEYFTPRHIVKTMVRLVNPQIGEKIYDPFCGTGGFLIESFRYMKNNMVQTEGNLKLLRESSVYGNEITNTARITKMNMILAGDGHSNIEKKDSLAFPIDGGETYLGADGQVYHRGFDVVLANMPYSQKTRHGNLYDLPGTNGDSICVQHCMKAINSAAPDGRMALVVPEGFLFRKDLARTREYLLEHCQLQSIISLPQGVFLPYTGVKTDIIYATNVNKKTESSKRSDFFWYFDAKSDGYTLDNHRRKLDTPSDLSKYEEYRKLDQDQKDDMLKAGFEMIPFDKVRKNSNVLVGSRYRDMTVLQNDSYHFVRLGDVAEFIRGVSFPKSAQTAVFDRDSLKIVTTRAAQADQIDYDSLVYIDKKYRKDEKIIRKGDILISLANSLDLVGRVTYVSDDDMDMPFGAFMGLLRVNRSKIRSEYLFAVLQSENAKKYFKAVAKTTTNISNITFEDLSDFTFPLPDMEIQANIVSEIDSYRQIIEGAKAVINNYHPKIVCDSDSYRALEEVAAFRPSKNEVKNLPGDTLVSFVPMADINTFEAFFQAREERKLEDVLSGFTYFKDEDVLLAKITPCFENGKAGIARNLKNGIGFGSTEYIVMRADREIVYPEWIFYHINTHEFIEGGKAFMTGTAGQQRIDVSYVKQFKIPVPSLEEQKKILDEIRREQSLIRPSEQLVEVFAAKIEARIAEVWGK